MDPTLEKSPHELVNTLLNTGWTQSELAEEVGISQPSISRIAVNPTIRPRHDIVDHLRHLVRVTSNTDA